MINACPETRSIEAAKIDDIQDESWYPDSRATNHVTNNLSNLNLGSKDYEGKHLIHMGNGESIKITHTGNASFVGKIQLFLNSLLRVSSIR